MISGSFCYGYESNPPWIGTDLAAAWSRFCRILDSFRRRLDPFPSQIGLHPVADWTPICRGLESLPSRIGVGSVPERT